MIKFCCIKYLASNYIYKDTKNKYQKTGNETVHYDWETRRTRYYNIPDTVSQESVEMDEIYREGIRCYFASQINPFPVELSKSKLYKDAHREEKNRTVITGTYQSSVPSFY